ncbi:MAG: hypothetical protein ACKO5E_12705 [bacterium]
MQIINNFRLELRFLIALSLACITLAGCGSGDGKTRVAVEGEIKLNGKALPSGLVSFLPTDHKGEAAVAKIENGKYSIERANGPVLGSYKVLINSKQPTGKKLRDQDNPAQLIKEEREVVPSQYNSNSTLTIEIKKGGQKDFDLKGEVKQVALIKRSGR